MSETFTLYKLIILYMLDKVDFPLTNAQISEFILNKGYTTYFKEEKERIDVFIKNYLMKFNMEKSLKVFEQEFYEHQIGRASCRERV